MDNSRLVRLLHTLSAKEGRALRRYVASPFFNRNERLLVLLDWLMARLPEPGDDKAAVHQALFGGEAPFDEQPLYDHFSALLRLVEGFLTWQAGQAQAFEGAHHLAQAILERDDSQFPRYHQQLLRVLEKQPHRDSHYFFQRYQAHLQADAFFGRQQRRTFDQNLSGLEAALDTFYLASKLQHACEMLNRNNIINSTYQPRMMEPLEAALADPTHPYRQVPVVNIYFHIYLTLTRPEDESHYEALVRQLDAHAGDFPRAEAYTMYSYALNYCTRQVNQGQAGYLDKIFRLFRQLLAKDILIEAGYLAHWHVKNIVTVGLRLREYAWVRSFLEEYRERIHPEQRAHVYHFYLATYYYEQRQYPEALRELQQVVFTDVYYDLGARSMLLKIYYESGEYEALDYHIRAFQTYLRRNKDISAGHRRIHRNLIRFVRKLRKLRRWDDPERVAAGRAALLEEIAQVREIADIKWLRNQLAVLEQI